MSPDEQIAQLERERRQSPMARLKVSLQRARRAFARAERLDDQLYQQGRIAGLERAVRLLEREVKR